MIRLEIINIKTNIILKWALRNTLEVCEPDTHCEGYRPVAGCLRKVMKFSTSAKCNFSCILQSLIRPFQNVPSVKGRLWLTDNQGKENFFSDIKAISRHLTKGKPSLSKAGTVSKSKVLPVNYNSRTLALQ